ncbi:MAG: UDP-2,3-diacylglucosamine diphosphatase [Bdellovibrionales bacterium]|nr:UDP-2,3-diacylglucosamine diphosphatase [Bdellovibrionales bacterium]
MSIKALFVSDLHLGDPGDERTKKFLNFLSRLGGREECTHLFLLGDIFDLWIAHHSYFVDRFRPVIEQLRRLQAVGIELHYFEGNHDLYLRDYWQNQLGLVVHSGPCYFTLDGLVFRLEHGDQMDPDDKGYIFLRWLLRTRVLRFLAFHLSGKILAKIGEKASRKSRQYTGQVRRQSDLVAKQKMSSHAVKVFSERPFDILIAGHLHVKEDKQIALPGRFIHLFNLGSWIESPQVLRISNSKISGGVPLISQIEGAGPEQALSWSYQWLLTQ